MKIARPPIITAPAAFPREILDTWLLPALERELKHWAESTGVTGDDRRVNVSAFHLLDDVPGTSLEGRRLNYVIWGACQNSPFVAGGTLHFTRDAATQECPCFYKMKLTVIPG